MEILQNEKLPNIYSSIYLSICLSVCLSIYLYIYLSIYLWLYRLLLDLRRFISFIFTQSATLLGRGISPSQGRYLHTGQQTQNKRKQTPMPQV
jgi:hypothetical protein